MKRELHVRFCEGLGVQLPWATHLPPFRLRESRHSGARSSPGDQSADPVHGRAHPPESMTDALATPGPDAATVAARAPVRARGLRPRRWTCETHWYADSLAQVSMNWPVRPCSTPTSRR